MFDDNVFAELIRRLRAGDPLAAEELVCSYEPAIRREVHCRLRDPRLRRAFDSMDICQSVLASFFVRATAGEFDLNYSDQLRKLLVGMARKKLLFQVRKQRAQRRDVRRLEPIARDDEAAVAADPSPSRLCEAQDLILSFQQRLNSEERQLLELRTQGWVWPEIAATVGGTPGGRRKQHTRAINRVARELGLDEGEYE